MTKRDRNLDLSFRSWPDLSEAGLDLILVTVPAGRSYFVARPIEAGTTALEDNASTLRDLGFRAPPSGAEIFLCEARFGRAGKPGRYPEAFHLDSRIPGGKKVPFDPTRHYVDQRRPDGPYRNALGTILKKLDASLASDPEAGTVRARIGSIVEETVQGLSASKVAGIAAGRPDLFERRIEGSQPGDTVGSALRKALAADLAEAVEKKVAAVHDVVEEPAGPSMS